MSKTKYKYLAEPISIGKLNLKNRMMKNATGFFWDDPNNGLMDDRYIAFFEALAKGGIALVSSAVGPLTRDLEVPMPGYRIRSDEFIPGWKKWSDAIHKHGCYAFHQLFHLGPMVPVFGFVSPGPHGACLRVRPCRSLSIGYSTGRSPNTAISCAP